MCNHYKSERIIGRWYKQFTKSLPFLFLFLSLIFSSCQPVTNNIGGGTGGKGGTGAKQSGEKPFFTLTVRASNKRSTGDSLRATVTYEPEVTWESEQGFRSAVTDFVIMVGNEAPQTVQLGSSVSSRGTYPEGSDVTVSYEAYGNVTFKNERGKTETKREVIASESKTVKVASSGTTVNFKVSEGIKIPDSYTEVVEDGKVKYVAGVATLGNVTGLPEEKEYAPGAIVTVAGEPSWSYGDFTHWTANVDLQVTTPDGGTSTVQKGNPISAGSTFTMPDGGVLLTANWQKKPYTITYNLATPVNATVTPSRIDDVTQDALTQVTLAAAPTVNNPVTNGSDKKNYTFVNWKDTSDGDKTYNAGTQITLTKDMTLEAVWSDEPVYTITFDQGSAASSTVQGLPSSLTVISGQTSQAWTNPTAAGYIFSGWKITDTANPNTVINQNAGAITSYAPTQNVTLTAQWTLKNYTVTFNTDGGSTVNPITDFNINYGGAFSNATKQGYSFQSWQMGGTDYTADTLKAGIVAGTVGSTSTTIALTARWNELSTLYVSDSGSDSNSGESADNAFAQLKKACDIVNAGSLSTYTIIVSGTITETKACILNTNKTVTIKTDTQAATILRGSGETSSDGSGTDFKIEITNGTVNFEGTSNAPLTIDGNKNQFSGHQYLLLHIASDSNNVNVKIGSNVNFQNNSRTKDWAMGSAVGITGANVTLTLDGGAIKDNVSWRLGAGVEIRNGATFIMNSGTISDNTITNGGSGGDGSGGGVYVGGTYGGDKAPAFTMNGGTITGNTAPGRGGGIFVEAGGICTVSQSASVTGNTATGNGAGSSGNQIYAEANATYNGTVLSSVTKEE